MKEINLKAFDDVKIDNATLFVAKYLQPAKNVEKRTGLHHIAILTQSALESAWGTKAPGNMFFGVKDSKGNKGQSQLLVTTEYSTNFNLKFPEILSKELVYVNGEKLCKYTVKDWFRKFDTPEESFQDHVDFLFSNPRYKKALEVRKDYNRFFEEIAKAGYATAPNYADILKSVAKSVIKRLP